jgi:hypothetical protein
MLTDAALKYLKPKAKIYKASDRDGMHVRVAPTGGRPSVLARMPEMGSHAPGRANRAWTRNG